MIDPVIDLSLRLALSLLFAGAAWHKVSDLRRFEAAVRGYDLLPARTVPVVSKLLPLAEASIALGLVYGPTRPGAAGGAISILLLYAASIALNLARGRRDIECGCFAASSRAPLNGWLVARNLALAAAAYALVWPSRPRELVWMDWLTITTTLIALSLLWLAGQRLAETGPALRRMGGNR